MGRSCVALLIEREEHMEFRYLGRSGLRVSKLCLGTMTFAHGADYGESERMVSLSLDRGINFFDTADSYANGLSEEYLGKALGRRRSDVVLATKFTNQMGSGPNDGGTSRIHLMRAAEDSLRRLGTDVIDLYYIHHTDYNTPLEETLRALDDLVRQGKVRYIACSNFHAWRLVDAYWISGLQQLEPIIAYQGCYSLVVRDLETEVFRVCREKGVGVVNFGSVASGFLTGKYLPGSRVVTGTRSEEGWAFVDYMFAPQADEILTAVLEESKSLGCTPGQLSIAWTNGVPAISSTLIGARTQKQLEENLAAADIEVPTELRRRLDEISHTRPGYPEIMERDQQERRDSAIE